MGRKAMNFKFDEAEIAEMKNVAMIFNMTVTDLIKEAVEEYLVKMKNDPFYRLTMSVQDASSEESEEILTDIEKLNDDDLTIAASKKISI